MLARAKATGVTAPPRKPKLAANSPVDESYRFNRSPSHATRPSTTGYAPSSPPLTHTLNVSVKERALVHVV